MTKRGARVDIEAAIRLLQGYEDVTIYNIDGFIDDVVAELESALEEVEEIKEKEKE